MSYVKSTNAKAGASEAAITQTLYPWKKIDATPTPLTKEIQIEIAKDLDVPLVYITEPA
jgi:hypothetical protein